MNVDDFLPKDTKTKSNGSIDSVNNQDQSVPLQEPPSGALESRKSEETKKTSYLPSILSGGNIADITNSVTNLVTKHADEKSKEIVYNFFANSARGFGGALPLICKGLKCHPAGTRIKTTEGYKAVEALDQNKDRLVSWDRPNNGIRGIRDGYGFSLHQRDYSGVMYTIYSSHYSYSCTHDHHVTVRWSDTARELFAVYLMSKGDFWRVGKVKLFCGKQKALFGPLNRARTEQADAFWILGVYKTNTEALLAEEKFSCLYGISKSCFKATQSGSVKWNGLYKWITQEQLDEHHRSLSKGRAYYANILESLGKCIDHPFTQMDTKKGRLTILELNACNIVSGYMECPSEETVQMTRSRKDRGTEGSPSYLKSKWVTIETKFYNVENIPVFSVGVKPYDHYIANGLVTHNCPFIKICPLNQAKMELPIDSTCPVEQGLVQIWVNKHLDALGIKDYNDPVNSFDMDIIYELAAHELIRWRIGAALSKDGTLSKEKVTGYSLQGEPIFEEIVSPLLEHLEAHSRISLRLKEALVATRREQIQAGRNISSSDKPTDLVTKARNIMKARQEAQSERVKDADFDVK